MTVMQRSPAPYPGGTAKGPDLGPLCNFGLRTPLRRDWKRCCTGCGYCVQNFGRVRIYSYFWLKGSQNQPNLHTIRPRCCRIRKLETNAARNLAGVGRENWQKRRVGMVQAIGRQETQSDTVLGPQWFASTRLAEAGLGALPLIAALPRIDL